MNNFPKPGTIFWSGDDLRPINKVSLLEAATERRLGVAELGQPQGENLLFNDPILFLNRKEICNQETAVL